MQAVRRLPKKSDPNQPNGLAPEVGAAVLAAREKIAHAIQVANLSGDDLGATLEALSEVVGVLYRMLTDHALAVSKAGLDASQILPPLIEAMSREMRREVPALRRAFDRRTAAWLAFAGVALLVAGLAIGWWWGSGSVLEVCRIGQVLHDPSGRAYCAAWLPTK